MSTLITILILLICAALVAYCIWYYFKEARPVDKEIKEGQKRLNQYEKYKSEIRNF